MSTENQVSSETTQETTTDATAPDATAPTTPASPTNSLADSWESRYAESDGVWSGKVNPTFQTTIENLDVRNTLPNGTALDLGSGEGADAIWLAQLGLKVTGVDISATATRRATEAAAERNHAEDTTFITADLHEWLRNARKEGLTFDLITASFLHSKPNMGTFNRDQLLRDAIELVTPGGYLVAVSHAEAPEWVGDDAFAGVTPEDELNTLQLSETEWTVHRAEIVSHAAVGPDGAAATLQDGVFVAHRSDQAI